MNSAESATAPLACRKTRDGRNTSNLAALPATRSPCQIPTRAYARSELLRLQVAEQFPQFLLLDLRRSWSDAAVVDCVCLEHRVHLRIDRGPGLLVDLLQGGSVGVPVVPHLLH